MKRIAAAFAKENLQLEILVIDDNSPDGTAAAAEQLSRDYPVKVIKRIDKRGLGSAIIDGISSAQGKVIAVIDADLSHPPEALQPMYQLISSGQADMVVGSRRVSGGGTSEWVWYRKIIHWVAATLGSFLTPVKDLTSGFFMFKRNIIEGINIEPRSWKIGLEIMVKGRHKKIIEYPIVFIERAAGQSKMGNREVWAYLRHLLALGIYKLSR